MEALMFKKMPKGFFKNLAIGVAIAITAIIVGLMSSETFVDVISFAMIILFLLTLVKEHDWSWYIISVLNTAIFTALAYHDYITLMPSWAYAIIAAALSIASTIWYLSQKHPKLF
jgi:hypothetical protein